MTPKGLTMLAIATAAAVAGAALSAGAWQTGNGEESRGERFLPELADQANRIDSIRVRTGGWQVSLAKRGERFVDASGFPARLETIRDLVTGLAGLTIEERKTARPERYAELEVDARVRRTRAASAWSFRSPASASRTSWWASAIRPSAARRAASSRAAATRPRAGCFEARPTCPNRVRVGSTRRCSRPPAIASQVCASSTPMATRSNCGQRARISR
ncbi:MAG: hypothetical protein R3E48_18450 [Burkholderiaceae bacterium]